MVRLIVVIVAFAAASACKTENEAFCRNPANAGVDGCPGDATNGGACSGSGDCKDPSFGVCDTAKAGGTCVQCTATDHKACVNQTPRCDSDACVACVDDNDCGGLAGVCLPSGACAASTSIIHAISAGGSETTSCGGTGIGNACTLDKALTIAAAGKNVIKLDDVGPYVSSMMNFVVNTDIAVDLVVDARGATLNHHDDGPIITIANNKGLTILGGTINGAHGGGGDGIRCNSNAKLTIYDTTITASEESAIDASSCTLAITHATIASNSKSTSALFAGIEVSNGSLTISRSQIISNKGGGITFGNNGNFTIVGNVFLSNGDSTMSNIGGLSVTTTTTGNRIEFNTFTDNKSKASLGAGIICSAPAEPGAPAPATDLTVQNNIVWNNNGATGLQVGGTCLHAFSDIGTVPVPGGPTGIDGGMNFSTNPMFLGAADLQVNTASPVRGKANPKADLNGIAAKDVKGAARVLRAGAGADVGAYVVPAP
jgi:hypothetical protein